MKIIKFFTKKNFTWNESDGLFNVSHLGIIRKKFHKVLTFIFLQIKMFFRVSHWRVMCTHEVKLSLFHLFNYICIKHFVQTSFSPSHQGSGSWECIVNMMQAQCVGCASAEPGSIWWSAKNWALISTFTVSHLNVSLTYAGEDAHCDYPPDINFFSL